MSSLQPLILSVDDDAELSAMVVELLAREGWSTHAVLTAGDGERALRERRPDLVLLDAMLPDGNGFDLARLGGSVNFVRNDQEKSHAVRVAWPSRR